MTSSLKRIWKQIPLHRLTQGSTLTVRSTVPITSVTFKPSWRDDGAVHFEQQSSSGCPPLSLNISQRSDAKTSLGRLAPSVELLLSPSSDSDHEESHNSDLNSISNTMHNKTKPINKVIYDDGTIERMDESTIVPEGSIRTDYQDGIAHIHDPRVEPTQGESCFLTIETPEALNLVCELEGGDINVTGKVEGDTKLITKHGNIQVKKIRGHNLELETNGSIFVSSLLEAQSLSVQVNNGRIRAKQIHGSTVNITANCDSYESHEPHIFDSPDDEGSAVDISALFVSSGHGAGAAIQCQGSPTRRSVRIKSHHGPLQVKAAGTTFPSTINPSTERRYPVVELGGVNGSCEVFVHGFKDGTNAENIVPGNNNACELHVDSLSPDSISVVSSRSGDVGITLDRKVESDLRLATVSDSSSLEACSSLLADEEKDSMVTKVLKELPCDEGQRGSDKRIDMLTTAFVEHKESAINIDQVQYMSGSVVNKSHEPDSRFDRKVQNHSSVGKIRIESAADQALNSFSSATDGENESISGRPLLAVACTGKIKVETVSWLGAIARRYGMTETKKELGRTATRSGRPLQDIQE